MGSPISWLRPTTVVAALLAAPLAVVVTATPAHAATVTFDREAEWSGGSVATMTVRNDTDSTLTPPATTTVSPTTRSPSTVR